MPTCQTKIAPLRGRPLCQQAQGPATFPFAAAGGVAGEGFTATGHGEFVFEAPLLPQRL